MKKRLATPKLRVDNTHKYGTGVFAEEDIASGQIVATLGGERISLSLVVDRICQGEERRDDPLQIGLKTYLDLDALLRSFNHNCDPNCGVKRTSELFALRDIRKGEELTFDYSTTVAPTDWTMNCQCGAAQCRQRIGSILTLSRPALERYKQAGALQDYMKRLLKRIEGNGGNYTLPQYERDANAKVRFLNARC
ncbi:MAG: SET domain-containing protein-lysine N-methyltransferase [Thiothrix sp.]|uniref:SET domain-containing protein n=1 Tax=Thiothrix sp. TaxID=1032 RepID=UPI002621D26D|nr:SET domain-containing protein-lysine N-methyltransferase [Thiothrix sp.]MDD5391979.1 SET domain-containing protein-lysine N-methyltransferase [Thiothrix sp.]